MGGGVSVIERSQIEREMRLIVFLALALLVAAKDKPNAEQKANMQRGYDSCMKLKIKKTWQECKTYAEQKTYHGRFELEVTPPVETPKDGKKQDSSKKAAPNAEQKANMQRGYDNCMKMKIKPTWQECKTYAEQNTYHGRYELEVTPPGGQTGKHYTPLNDIQQTNCKRGFKLCVEGKYDTEHKCASVLECAKFATRKVLDPAIAQKNAPGCETMDPADLAPLGRDVCGKCYGVTCPKKEKTEIECFGPTKGVRIVDDPAGIKRRYYKTRALITPQGAEGKCVDETGRCVYKDFVTDCLEVSRTHKRCQGSLGFTDPESTSTWGGLCLCIPNLGCSNAHQEPIHRNWRKDPSSSVDSPGAIGTGKLRDACKKVWTEVWKRVGRDFEVCHDTLYWRLSAHDSDMRGPLKYPKMAIGGLVDGLSKVNKADLHKGKAEMDALKSEAQHLMEACNGPRDVKKGLAKINQAIMNCYKLGQSYDASLEIAAADAEFLIKTTADVLIALATAGSSTALSKTAWYAEAAVGSIPNVINCAAIFAMPGGLNKNSKAEFAKEFAEILLRFGTKGAAEGLNRKFSARWTNKLVESGKMSYIEKITGKQGDAAVAKFTEMSMATLEKAAQLGANAAIEQNFKGNDAGRKSAEKDFEKVIAQLVMGDDAGKFYAGAKGRNEDREKDLKKQEEASKKQTPLKPYIPKGI